MYAAEGLTPGPWITRGDRSSRRGDRNVAGPRREPPKGGWRRPGARQGPTAATAWRGPRWWPSSSAENRALRQRRGGARPRRRSVARLASSRSRPARRAPDPDAEHQKHSVRLMIGGEYTVRSDLRPTTRARWPRTSIRRSRRCSRRGVRRDAHVAIWPRSTSPTAVPARRRARGRGPSGGLADDLTRMLPPGKRKVSTSGSQRRPCGAER
jgi:hypothetical protein